MGYSPDGIVMNDRIIEIKCPEKGKGATIEDVIPTLDYLQKNDTGVILKKRNYYCQIQLGMFITSLRKCDFILYAPHDRSLKILQVTYNEEFIIKIWPSLMFVYFRFILKKLIILKTSNDDKTKKIFQEKLVRKPFKLLSNKVWCTK